MLNPWTQLPKTPPYVLPCDEASIGAFNSKHPERDLQLWTDRFPEPFLGRPDAPLVLLNGNPGSNPDLDADSIKFNEADHPALEKARHNLLHEQLDYPFWTLDPAFAGTGEGENVEYPGRTWWRKRLRRLIESCEPDGIRNVANRLLCVEFFPYHSQSFSSFPRLASQEYSFHLVAAAMQRNAVIVVMRSKRLWFQAVDRLKDYPKCYTLKNPQSPYLSETNCSNTHDWQQICHAIGETSK